LIGWRGSTKPWLYQINKSETKCFLRLVFPIQERQPFFVVAIAEKQSNY